jgi:tetratricopeptide (TPR) repeat protein
VSDSPAGNAGAESARIDVRQESGENLGSMIGVNIDSASGPIEVNTATARFVIGRPAPRLGGYIPAPAVERYLPRGDVEKKVAERLQRREGSALAAVVGMPGLGKSEFAKHIAAQLKDDFQAVLWLELGAKTSAQVISDLARQAGVALDASLGYNDQVTEIKRSLNQVRALVVLDDVRLQHTAQLRDYLPPSPPCAALLTSRLLQLGALPPAAIYPLGALDVDSSLALLASILGDGPVSAEKEAALALAQRCAYNPLALDIAARRIVQLSGLQNPVAIFLSALAGHLEELSLGGDPRMDLFFVFDESYLSLEQADQQRFRRLAAFASTGFSPSGAAFIWGEALTPARLALARLANLSLLASAGGNVERWRLHDLLNEYAGNKLAQSGEELETRLAQADFVIDLFNRSYDADAGRAPQVSAELDNLRAAADYLKSAADAHRLARLSAVVRNWMVSVFHDWDGWEDLLNAAHAHPSPERVEMAHVYQATGDLYSFRHRMDDALQHYQNAGRLFLETGNAVGAADALLAAGDVFRLQGQPQRALELLTQALSAYGQANHRGGMGNALLLIAEVLRTESQYEQAQQAYLRALEAFIAENQRVGQAAALRGIGDILVRTGDAQQALNSYQGALMLYEQAVNPEGVANTCWSMGKLFAGQGSSEEAMRYFNRALEGFQALQEPLGQANTLGSISDLSLRAGDLAAAEQSARAAAALYQAIGMWKEHAGALLQLGNVLKAARRYEDALLHYRAAFERYDQRGYTNLGADALLAQALLLLRSDVEQAGKLFQQAGERYQQARDGFGLAMAHGNLGYELKALGRLEDARRFLNYAADLFDQMGRPQDAQQARQAAANP